MTLFLNTQICVVKYEHTLGGRSPPPTTTDMKGHGPFVFIIASPSTCFNSCVNHLCHKCHCGILFLFHFVVVLLFSPIC